MDECLRERDEIRKMLCQTLIFPIAIIAEALAAMEASSITGVPLYLRFLYFEPSRHPAGEATRSRR